MRLDELKWWTIDTIGPQAMARFPFNVEFQLWHNRDGTYNFWFGSELRYSRLDAFTAQAVLFELTSLNRMNQNRTIEPYLDPTTSPETSDT